VKALVKISQTPIGNSTVQTVNARDLHAFLEVGKDFSNWIKDRIEQYGFVKDDDYVVFANSGENPQGGRPAKEYALSLDMAKELSMVERNERGKQARQYFIECERQAKAVPTISAVKQTVEAARAFPPLFRAARLIGCDKNTAAIAANQAVMAATKINLLQQLGHIHLIAANQENLYYTPTELGQMLGGVSSKQVNLLLAGAGLQARIGEHWQPLDAGQEFVRLYDTGKRHGSGTPIQRVKWADAVLPLLQTEAVA